MDGFAEDETPMFHVVGLPSAASSDDEEGLMALEAAIQEYRVTGQLTALMGSREELRESVLSQQFRGGDRDALRRCAAGELGLWLLDVDRTLESLHGVFEIRDDRVRACAQAVDRLHDASPEYAGALVSIAAQLQYRLHVHFDRGLDLVNEASGYLRKGGGAATTWSFKNEIARSRLLYRAGRQAEAEKILEETIRKLRGEYALESRSLWDSLDIVLGMACEIHASMLTTKGELDASMRLILEALQLLGGYPPRDPVRSAYAAMTASRIFAGYGPEHSIMALRYARLAVDGFSETAHPFEARAQVQLARCQIKLRDFDAAETGIRAAENALRGIGNQDEKLFAGAELDLTRARRFQALARGSSNAQRREYWKKVSAAARRAERTKRIPDRVRADAKLRAGQAMLEMENANGEERVRTAIDIASQGGRVKVVVAGKLVLAEYRHRKRDDLQALGLLESAEMLLEHVESEALRRWLTRIFALVDQPIRVPVPRGGLEKAQKEFREKLLLYYWERSGGDKDEFQRLAGVKKGIYYEARTIAKTQ